MIKKYPHQKGSSEYYNKEGVFVPPRIALEERKRNLQWLIRVGFTPDFNEVVMVFDVFCRIVRWKRGMSILDYEISSIDQVRVMIQRFNAQKIEEIFEEYINRRKRV